ncbi:hypothetical protein DBY68_016980 [Pseudocitrobacter sp. RIT415]|uniref:hypothetical protein n=1 Tax=Pseudocitrobacter sp. RIT415 TaxID=2202163 RepID=UPI000D3AF155|nr:hypothetical protein [Pseudocitrobacter sp. RIT 415]RAU45308.1 hypothetical protein DBY68_016980 [Pseudocitrobacter sp. RIT 415]
MAKRQYSVMHLFPKLVAMLRGSENRHFNYGIKWLEETVIIFRNGEYQIMPINYVKFFEPNQEELNMLAAP